MIKPLTSRSKPLEDSPFFKQGRVIDYRWRMREDSPFLKRGRSGVETSKAKAFPNFAKSASRLFYLDVLKAISIVAVVSFHAIVFPRSTYANHEVLLEALFAPLRFCVPVLLTISCFLLERSLEKSANQSAFVLVGKRLSRIAIPIVFWFSLMAGVKLLRGNSFVEVIPSILRGEIFTGAYYLLIMVQIIPLFVFTRSLFKREHNLALFVLLQMTFYLMVYGLLTSSSGDSIIHVLETVHRPLILYWFGYIALGIFFYRNQQSLVQLSSEIPLYIKAIFLVLLSLGLMLEFSQLAIINNGSVSPFDYLTMSCILSVPIFMICFASVQENQLPRPLKQGIQLLSQYSLGIFCINGVLHQTIISLLAPYTQGLVFTLPELILMKFVGWMVLLSLSLGLSVILGKLGAKAIVC